MGTNYYARIIPTKKRKKELYDAIDADDIRRIENLEESLYGNIHLDLDTDEIVGGRVHLGKSSNGWKFLWNPNVFVVRNGHQELVDEWPGGRIYKRVGDPDTAKYFYPLTKKDIKDFIDRKDVVLYDEYDTVLDKEEFWKMALEYGQKDGWDAA